jgi:hypothetical protein
MVHTIAYSLLAHGGNFEDKSFRSCGSSDEVTVTSICDFCVLVLILIKFLFFRVGFIYLMISMCVKEKFLMMTDLIFGLEAFFFHAINIFNRLFLMIIKNKS